MRKIVSTVVCLSMATILLSSCVANRKYRVQKYKAEKEMQENQALQARVQAAEDSISQLSGKVNALGDVYQSTTNELNMSKEQIAAQRQRVKQLEDFIAQQQKSTEALRKKIADALVGFNSNELTVTMKNGRVYVSMQESLLFPSGSAVVNPKGKDALAKLAGVLNTNPDININVEGHTDSVPIHNKVFSDNWALSVTRATSIAHVLIEEYNVQPARVVASGRSSYDPLQSNQTPDGRAQNRRTEIILEPKLDELMQLLNSTPPPPASMQR
jgi:chemotaxis protein MotB